MISTEESQLKHNSAYDSQSDILTYACQLTLTIDKLRHFQAVRRLATGNGYVMLVHPVRGQQAHQSQMRQLCPPEQSNAVTVTTILSLHQLRTHRGQLLRQPCHH